MHSEVFILSNQSSKGCIDLGTIYKIFGEGSFSFEAAYSKSKSDWSAFYTQYTAEHSMRYLTKKWGDGSDYACLLQLRVKESESPLKLIKVSHSILCKHSVSGKDKANLIKSHLEKEYGIMFAGENSLLLKTLGENRIILQCVDSEDEEIVIPHDLLNENNFMFEGIARFKKSQDGMLRTIGWAKYDNSLIKEEENFEFFEWEKVNGEEQFEPYQLVLSNKKFQEHLSNMNGE